MARRTLSLRSALRARDQRAGGGAAPDTALAIVASSILIESVAADGSFLVPIPAGTVDGHYMVLFLGKTNDVAFTNALGLASWTEIVALRELNAAGDDFTSQVWVKVAASEGATVQVKNPEVPNPRECGGIIVTFKNQHADGFDVTPVAGHAITVIPGLNDACPAITSLTDNAIFLNMHYQLSLVTAYVAPSGYAMQESDFALAGCQMAVAAKTLGAAGLETPGVWVNTGTTQEGSRTSFIVKAV